MVLSRTGGAAELVIHGEQGFIFQPGDVATLAQQLTTLTSSSLRERFGAAAARRVRELFTVQGMAARFTGCFEQLLETSTEWAARRPKSSSHA